MIAAGGKSTPEASGARCTACDGTGCQNWDEPGSTPKDCPACRGTGRALAVAPEAIAAVEAMLRRHMAMYDWTKRETVAINDYILTVSEGIAEDLADFRSAAPAREASNAPGEPDEAACHCGDVGHVVSELSDARWGENAPVSISTTFYRCSRCGSEWYTPYQSNRHTFALLKATVAALTAERDALQRQKQDQNHLAETEKNQQLAPHTREKA